MSITWSYGVTTVASRIASGLLERTLNSLAKGGFPNPRLFIDGIPNEALPGFASSLQVTCRNPAIRIYGNFHLGLSELFIREAHADFYAMFQDDFVTYPHLREYLESCELPAKGYFNLYTFPENTKPQQGWYLSNQLGKGAVGLVFSSEAAKALLHSSYWIGRPASNPNNPMRLWKFIDGGIVETMRKAGYNEYVHNPSLVQHTGIKSSLGNGKQALAPTFKGEYFDALELLPKKPVINVKTGTDRIGLVGYNVATGLGELNRQIAKYGDVYRWLVRPHAKLGVAELSEDTDCIVCPTGEKLPVFLNEVDIVVFCESPYYNELPELCKRLGKRTVCVPMMEWMPAGAKGWPQLIDLFLCPTKHCYEQFSHVVPCVDFPWPLDLERFKFQPRTVCNRFLFLNGHGGWHGRKGAEVIREALKLWPEFPLIVRSQENTSWPSGVEVLPSTKSNSELYEVGDVLVSPHSVDGLGLEGQEAMACGMPVISTKGRPWEEVPALARILAKSEKRNVRRPVDWYLPDPVHLVETCKHWQDRDISKSSQQARTWAESMDWSKFSSQFKGLVRNGKPTR